MTWLRKFRGDSAAPILADYFCAYCDRFEATLPRVDGGPPEFTECPKCGCEASWCMPAPRTGVKAGEAVKGKVMEYPPEHVVMDTRPLADGVPYGEWRDKQDAITRDLGLKRARAGRR